MNAKATTPLPGDLENARRRFEQWRQVRKAPTPIPESLWSAAVTLAGKYGISRTAKVLRVAYYSLQERVERAVAPPVGPAMAKPPTFLEVAVPARPTTGECFLEWEDGSGAKMRVHLQGVAVPDLVALSRSFWEGRR
ncbi:MAG: hypothetical protein PHU80_12280 [Kiritimatiellae bacterium]|nr:hypothetical protein [Kiritimatiellia bacterium]